MFDYPLVHSFIETVFGICLFVNATLFVPQVIKLWQTKSPQGLSLIMFAGFNVIQLFEALHAIIRHDMILLAGMCLSLLSCGSVTVLIIVFRVQDKIKMTKLNRQKNQICNS